MPKHPIGPSYLSNSPNEAPHLSEALGLVNFPPSAVLDIKCRRLFQSHSGEKVGDRPKNEHTGLPREQAECRAQGGPETTMRDVVSLWSCVTLFLCLLNCGQQSSDDWALA